jgi:AcrR family transcriptional regulator
MAHPKSSQASGHFIEAPLVRRLSGLQLPKEVVVEDQRGRVIAALSRAIFERGYGSTSVGAIIERAAISRRTFYDFYRDKADAFCAVHGEALDLLDGAMREALARRRVWSRQVEAAIYAGLRWAASNPALAALLVAEPLTAGPRFGYCHDLFVERFAPWLRCGRAAVPVQNPPALEEMVLAGFAVVVGRRIRAGCADELPALAPELTTLALASYAIAPRQGRLTR